MRDNALRAAWREGRKTINGWLAIPSGFSAELMAHQGWDSLTVDLQHGLVHYSDAVAMLQAISTTGVVPMARVPWLEPGIIMKLLDAGAYGIICPMVNTRADAERLVGACRYAPAGYRSFGPTRAVLYAGADYVEHANEQILCLAMIETATALDNLDEILAVPGLDGVYIGPADLSLSLGHRPALDPSEPEVLDAIARILAAARAHGRFAGVHTGSAAGTRRMHELGFDMTTIASDGRLMAAAASRALDEARGR